MIARCADCPWACETGSRDSAISALWDHRERAHDEQQPPMQLSSTTFREQALAAIRTLAETGRPFAIAEAHDLVTIEPVNPRTAWPAVTREAARLGFIEWAGSYADSPLATTKGSAVKLWRGRRRAA